MKYVYVALSLAALAACTSDPIERAARAEQEVGLICTNSVPTGSLLREKKCTTAEERERQRRSAEHQMVIVPIPKNDTVRGAR